MSSDINYSIVSWAVYQGRVLKENNLRCIYFIEGIRSEWWMHSFPLEIYSKRVLSHPRLALKHPDPENKNYRSLASTRWRRQWHPTPVFLPGKSHGRRTVHGVTRSRTWLRDFTFTFHFHALEKEMATQSSVLAWSIPGKGEPGGLLSMGSHRVRQDWSDLAAAAADPRGLLGPSVRLLCP